MAPRPCYCSMFFCSCGSKSKPPPSSTPTLPETSPEACVAKYLERLAAEDVSQLVSSYAASGRFCGGNQMASAAGANELRSTFEDIFREFNVSVTISKVDYSVISGATAVVAVTSTGTMTTKSTGDSSAVTHREIYYFTGVEGAWKIQLYMSNYESEGDSDVGPRAEHDSASGSEAK